jgi:hypothetical protein
MPDVARRCVAGGLNIFRKHSAAEAEFGGASTTVAPGFYPERVGGDKGGLAQACLHTKGGESSGNPLVVMFENYSLTFGFGKRCCSRIRFFAVFDDHDPAYKFGEGIDVIDERMPVSAYMKYFVREVDGKAWLLVSIACLLTIFDVVADINVVPIREEADFGKAVVLLGFTPLLSFLVTAMLRQLPFSSRSFSAWMRGAACLGTLLVLNF